jgi:AcrR family transcriptional regulator
MATRRAAALAMPRAERTRGPRRRLLPEARREELLAALERVVARDGLLAASVPRVVAEAGIAQGSFYRHFENIDAAFLVLVADVLDPVARAAREMDFSRVESDADVEAELLRYYRVLARQLARHPELCRAALQLAPALRGPVGDAMSAFFSMMRQRAAELMAPFLDTTGPHAADPEIIASALVGMVIGASEEALRLGDRFDPEHWAAELARFEAGAVLRLAHFNPSPKLEERRGK